MKFKASAVEPANGKYWVKIDKIEELTDGGIHLPQMTDAGGKLLKGSMPNTPLATIIAVGGPAAKGTPNEQRPQYKAGDRVFLNAIPQTVSIDGSDYTIVDFYHAIALVK